MNKVLIVDDAAFMRMSLRKMLERNGFEVIGEAENGELGIKKYKELLPDLVTLDITMPEKDGITALKEIYANDPNVKAVMISAMGQESMVKEAVVYGAKTFIVKPFTEEFLIQVMKKVASQ
jgi:two-component system chemotaxis response regulator CheY